MRRILFLAIALCCTLISQAALRGTHLNRNLRRENIPVEQATQLLGTWMKTSTDMTFVLVKDETDDLGFRHQTYGQQLNGIAVDGARLMVHSKDGRVTYVNGFVMEADAARPKKMPAPGKMPSSEGEVVLVGVDDGFHYAVKSFDNSTREYVYTDVETGQEVKRLSTICFSEPIGQNTISSQSYYYGQQQMDVTRLDDGLLTMADNTRRIYTYDAAFAGTIPDKYNISDSTDIKRYFDNELILAQTRRGGFSMQEITSASISLSEEAKKELGDRKLKMVAMDGEINIVVERSFGADDFPYVFNPMEHKTYNGSSYPLRMNDTDTTLVALMDIDDNLLDIETTAIDYFYIFPTKDGGDAVVTVTGQKGRISATATMKGIGHYGIDVHWGLQRVYDFYKAKFNYNSYDNAGSPIISIINPVVNGSENRLLNITEPNAFANTDVHPFLVFGRGTPSSGVDEMVDFSIVSHEFTHLVTGKTADLEYQGEPGALNEAFSDIFCAVAKKYVADNYLPDKKDDIEYVYSNGDDSYKNTEKGMLRLFCDPWRCGDPKAIRGKYWANPLAEEDHGGVHTNSNVLNFWFFLLAEGYDPESSYGLDTSVINEQWAKTASWKGLGMEKAAQIAFRILTKYMFSEANYRDAYKQSLVAVQDLGYDENSTEYQTVEQCWKAVAPEGYMEYDLTEIIGLELTSVATTKTYAANSNELVPYTGDELKVGEVSTVVTATMKDADRWREAYRPELTDLETKCYFFYGYSDNYDELDYSDFIKAFLKKCNDDKTIGNGYQETCSQELTFEAGSPLSVTLECPQLPLLIEQKKELLEDARTFTTEKYSKLEAEGDNVYFGYVACSGYPLKGLPSESGETITYRLYLIGEDKSETELLTEDIGLTEDAILGNQWMKDSQNRRFEELFFFANDLLYTPGRYKLKVSFSWESLKDAEFIFEVKSRTAISAISDLTSDAPADSRMTYDLQGRVVDKPCKGVYIRGGKKVVVR